MHNDFLHLPVRGIEINAAESAGACEWWRHTLGDGGINNLPLPPRVVQGVRQLHPRLIRVFLQEYFNVYPARGQLNWSILDPYMQALAETGAQVVASINFKPRPLYPLIDQRVWMPNDAAAYQQVIAALAQRYSVEQKLVTHWEVGNETDIGEDGGTPFLIPNPDDYLAFYQMTIQPILAVFPSARVGGAAACWIDNQPLTGLIERCLRDRIRLDFVSWHCYNDNPAQHVLGAQKATQRLAGYGAARPEMLVTEWGPQFMVQRDGMDVHRAGHRQHVAVQEIAFAPYRAATIAASIIGMLDAGVDWSFYYHLWDKCFYPDQFRPFYSEAGLDVMYEHWNEIPHRFGLFGVDGEVRPHYFVYQMLSRLGDERVAAQAHDPALRVLATRHARGVRVLLVNHELESPRDLIAQLDIRSRGEGEKKLTVYRLDAQRTWDAQKLALLPVEQRMVYTRQQHRAQVFMPANSVALVELDDIGTGEQ